MTDAKKKQLTIRLKRALKTAKEAQKCEKELAQLTEEIFGYNWSEVDADYIIDSLSGFGTMDISVDDFINEMEKCIKIKSK